MDIPWLQDTSSQGAQAAWSPSYRDVVIVNARNEQVASYNLSTYDLAVEANREELKDLLLSTAQLEDGDRDGVADDWEAYHFGSTSPTQGGDLDGDRVPAFSEYAFGSDPTDPASQGKPTVAIEMVQGAPHLTITFRRRIGQAGGLHYLLEEGNDLDEWTSRELAAAELRSMNPYDGTGTEIVTCRSTTPIGADGATTFLRVRASFSPGATP